MTTKYNSVISRQSEVEGRIREVKDKIDQSRSVNQTQIQESMMIEESYKSIELKKFIKKAQMRAVEIQTTEVDLANQLEHQMI